jgi:hypothetical protein
MPSPTTKAKRPKAAASAQKTKQSPKLKGARYGEDDDNDDYAKKTKRISNFRCKGDWRKMIDIAQRQGKDFYYTATNSTVIIRQDNCRYIYSDTDSYNYRSLHLFTKVRKEILKNIEEKKIVVPHVQSGDVDYYAYSKQLHDAKVDTAYEDVWELDINMAYYNAAYNLGYISRDFYDECRGLDKAMRLRLIGSIAILKTKFIYKEGRLEDVQAISNPILRSAWFNICKYVADAMRDMAKILGNDFLFYWVDGIVFKGAQHHQTIHDFAFLKYGFDFKLLKMDRILVKPLPDGIVHIDLEGVKDARKMRRFNLDTNRTKRAVEMIKEVNKFIPRGKIKKTDLKNII